MMVPEKIEFKSGVLDSLIHELLRKYPKKTFGILYAEQDSDAVVDYYIFHDDDREAPETKKSFQSVGRYYSNNANAGFRATRGETVREHLVCAKKGYRKVAVFHTHLRHPAYFAEIDAILHPSEALWHLLVSLRNPSFPEIAAFAIECGRVKRVRLADDSTSEPLLSGEQETPRLLNDVRFININGLYVSETLITNKQYYNVLRYHTGVPKNEFPVTEVTWRDAATFCVITGTRLLKEYEWASLCDDSFVEKRDGQRNSSLTEYAVFSESSENRLLKVRSRKPNKFGLYDMQGNAWEWCDSYDHGTAPTKGGSYYAFSEMCHSDARVILPKDYRARDLSFRVCYGGST